MIENEATISDTKTMDLRTAFEHRATWFYFLIEAAKKRGLDLDFAHEAIFNCGKFHGDTVYPKTSDIKEFAEAFANENVQNIFEMDVTTTDDELDIEFHYCPLVAAWQKLTGDDALIADLCDTAMDGDRGIINEYPDFEFELGDTIAKGNPTCKVCIRKVR